MTPSTKHPMSEREEIARIIDEHAFDTVKMHGRQNASESAVLHADAALRKADAIIAIRAPAATPPCGWRWKWGEEDFWKMTDDPALVPKTAAIKELLYAAPPPRPFDNTAVEKLIQIAEDVCWFDWSGDNNDTDAIHSIEQLRLALAAVSRPEGK